MPTLSSRNAFAVLGAILTLSPALCSAQLLTRSGLKLHLKGKDGTLEAYAVAENVVRVTFTPTGIKPSPTEVLDPHGLRSARPIGRFDESVLSTRNLSLIPSLKHLAIASPEASLILSLQDLKLGQVKLTADLNPTFYQVPRKAVSLDFYGARGFGLDRNRVNTAGLYRNGTTEVKAGWQGDGGAPFIFTKSWGLFVDTVDGTFKTTKTSLTFSKGSRKDLEFYIILGDPKEVVSKVADLSGHAPMPPKWSLGFLNSQWGTTQDSVKGYVDEYQSKKIPLDAFILDFDFKAWGEDNYGEFRWNSSSNPGNVTAKDYPNGKFPDGESGKFAKDLLAKGVHLVGIMKPRLVIENTEHKLSKAGAEIEAHHWQLPNQKPYNEYFSNRPALDLDFSRPDVRTWYWSHAKHLFQTGIAGWWNDEADSGFDSLGHFHMQQSLYEGQRSISNDRVFSLNRNFYLGAQRYGFGTWSGDINTGFESMREQATRMLATLDLGQSHWSMDSGGFSGHPSNENYARWLEFAALVPIMRVHDTYGELRQPWVYGPIAEAAAKKAINLRYSLLPSIYSWERQSTESGVGIVRPLFWEFPTDPASSNVTDEWMLGDALLAAPILEQGQTEKQVYLPPGTWFDYATNKVYEGAQTITIPVDSATWSDIPMFVQQGTLLFTQAPQETTSQPVKDLTLTIWPGQRGVVAKTVYYDDDGTTFAYEKGAYIRQEITAIHRDDQIEIKFDKPTGRWTDKTQVATVKIFVPDQQEVHVSGAATKVERKGQWTWVTYKIGTPGQISVDLIN